MKFTQAQLIEAVKAVGVPVVEVVEEGSDYTADSFLTAVDTAREPVVKQKVLPDMEAEALRKISGLVGDKLVAALSKATGKPRSEFKDIATDEEKIKFALDSFQEKYGKDTEGLREELATAVSKHNETLEKTKADHEVALKASNDKYIARDIQSYIAGTVLKDAPFPDGVDRNILAADLMRHLQEKYNLNYDEATKAVQLFKKDNPAAPAMNATGTNFVNPLDEAKEFFTPRGQWQTDMRRKNPGDAMNGKGEEYQQQNNNQPQNTDPKSQYDTALAAKLQPVGA